MSNNKKDQSTQTDSEDIFKQIRGIGTITIQTLRIFGDVLREFTILSISTTNHKQYKGTCTGV